MRTWALVAAVVLFTELNCRAESLSVKDFTTVQCATTLYAWSETADKPPTEVATGTVKDVSDSDGKWVKGELVMDILNLQDAAPGKETCTFELTSGSYSVRPDGSGVSRNSWIVAQHTDPRCASLHLDWFAKGGVDPKLKTHNPGEAVESIYMNGPNDGYQMAIGPAGFGTGTCKPSK